MRLRNIPRAAQTVAASPFVEQEPAAWRGRWQQRFGSEKPLHIEVGMGKGRFLMEMAAQNSQVNYIGLERYTSVLLRAVERRAAEEGGREPDSGVPGKEAGTCTFGDPQEETSSRMPGNLLFLCEDAVRLPELFAPGEVERIYLNFSDPWPKERHAARRLTSPAFLRRYEQILAPGGTIECKTDNQALFDFSLASAAESGWQVTASTRDLHHDALGEGNVMTEYEEKFSAKGNPICKMVLKRPAEGDAQTTDASI